MINQVIQLVKPKTFDVVTQCVELLDDSVIIRPTHLAICHADQRYYKGTRPDEVLNKKLPMALIHEATGIVQYDPKGELRSGERVVLIPNISGSYLGYEQSLSERNDKIGANYCPNGKFRSSGYDGFMQELVVQPRNLVIKVPQTIPSEMAAITELISVCMHAVKRFSNYSHGNSEVLGIWGDGNISYLMALILKRTYPSATLHVFGKHVDKLSMFSFVDGVHLDHASSASLNIQHFFECAGGEAQEAILNRMIASIAPGGTISTLGVCETKVAIDVRLLMEKGIVLVGDSRSNEQDFKAAITFMQDETIQAYIATLITNVVAVKNIQDIHQAFESDRLKYYGKTVMEWQI